MRSAATPDWRTDLVSEILKFATAVVYADDVPRRSRSTAA